MIVPLIPTKRRARHTRSGRSYTDSKTAAEMEAVRAAYDGGMHDGPVSVEIHTYAELPKSKPKRIQSEPNTCKPDIDNTCKAVLDALNGAAWRDDTQVVELTAVKHSRTRNGGDYITVEVRDADV